MTLTVGPKAAVMVLALAFAVSTTSVHAAFLNEVEIEKGTCFSRAAGFTQFVRVEAQPNFPVDILRVPGEHKKYFITCMEVHEDGPALGPSQIGLCSTPSVLSVCEALKATPNDWTCTDVPQYQRDPHSDFHLGGGKDAPEKIFKIQWTPQSTGRICFPRDLTFQFVGHSVVPEESNLAANITFIIIVLVVGALVAMFLAYQGKKVLRKFWKKNKARPQTHLTEAEQQNTMRALNGDTRGGAKTRPSGPIQPRGGPDLYDEDSDVVVSSGQQFTIIEEGTLEIRAQPMPKPWYQRGEYDLDKKKRLPGRDDDDPYGDDGRDDRDADGRRLSPRSAKRRSRSRQADAESIVKSPKSGRRGGSPRTPAGREQSSSYYIDMYDEADPYSTSDRRGGNADNDQVLRYSDHVAPPTSDMYDVDTGRRVRGGGLGGQDEDDEDIVLTCTDCLLPIRGPNTPQYCRVTGKRHY